MPVRGARPGLPRQPVQASAGDGPRDLILDATFALEPADPEVIKARLDDIRRWRQAHQPLGLPSAGSVFRNPSDGLGGAAHRGRRAEGLSDRRRGRLREARQLHRQRPEGHSRRRAAGRRSRAGGRGRRRPVSSSPTRSSSSATGRAGRGRPDRVGPAADRRAARRPVGRARRVGRVGDGHRAGALPRPARTSGRCSSTSTVGGGGCRPITVGTTVRAAAYDDPRIARRRGADRGRRRHRPAGRRRSGAGRRHRPARAVRRGRHDPGDARCGRPRLHRAPVSPPRRSAWTRRCSSGCAGVWGSPWSTGARFASRAGRPTAPASAARWQPSPPDRPTPRLMVKPARLGSSVGMTLVHDSAELAAALDLAFRYDTLARRGVVRARGARPRGVGHRQRPRPSRAVRPGRGRQRQRVLRLRREVHARPVRDVDPGRGHATSSAP